MKPAKTKWLAYTVLVGLMPIICRSLIWMITKSDTVTLLSASDVVAFGLVMHISTINELEHFSSTKDQSWKTLQNGVSIIFIALYSSLFAAIILSEKNASLIDSKAVLICVTALALVSLALGFSVLHRINASGGSNS